MAKITILGAGVMGSAFSVPLADNGHEIKLVGTHLDEEIVEQIHQDRIHPRLGVALPNSVQPLTYDRLGDAIDGADLLVVAVNSLGIDWVGMMLSMLGDELHPDMPLLFLTKGLEGKNDATGGGTPYLDPCPHAHRQHVVAGVVDLRHHDDAVAGERCQV